MKGHMFITKKHLSRRTFLNGVGVSMALPFLESMLPAATPLAQTAARGRTRLGCIYVPHGATMYKWTPTTEGSGFAFTETLAPLEKLLTYALGRPIEYYDMPTVRSIVRRAARNDYKFSSLVLGVLESAPFQMRKSRG